MKVYGQLENAQLEVQSSEPSSPEVGRPYFDSSQGMPKVYSGSAWLYMAPGPTRVETSGPITLTAKDRIVYVANVAGFTINLPAASDVVQGPIFLVFPRGLNSTSGFTLSSDGTDTFWDDASSDIEFFPGSGTVIALWSNGVDDWTPANIGTPCKRGIVEANASLTLLDDLVVVEAGGSARTITLPDISSTKGYGKTITVAKNDSGAGAVNVDQNGSDTTEGSTSATSLSGQWDTVTVMSEGFGNWIAVATTT